jgi:hypothetical protein
MVHAVDLAVPKIRAKVLVGLETLHGVTSGCCIHTLKSANQKSTCSETGCISYYVYPMAWHLLWYAENKRQKRVLKNSCPRLTHVYMYKLPCRSRGSSPVSQVPALIVHPLQN